MQEWYKKECKVKKKRIKFNNNIVYLVIAAIFVLMLIFGQGKKESDVAEEGAGVIEENAGSGFLVVETFPSGAEIFMDGTYIGKSPLDIYDVPVGAHDVVIKKEGYEEFTSEASVEAGKKTSLEARLVLMPVETPVEEKTAIENIEDKKEESAIAPKANNTINIGKKFLLYYDFSEGKFTELMHYDADIFSKRYDKYLVFTRSNPASIKAISKNIDEIKKEDCVGIKGQFEYLYSGQSLCVITKENTIAAIGGTWENTENAELIFKLFS